MASLSEAFKYCDVLSDEKNLLTFGNPKDERSRDMWKTPWGGFNSIIFQSIVLVFISQNILAIAYGGQDSIESNEVPIMPDENQLSFEDMHSMPVVHFSYIDSSIYLDPEHMAFAANIFVALQQTKRFENGTKVKEFQEFVPCRTVTNQTGYLEVDYGELFRGNQLIDNLLLIDDLATFAPYAKGANVTKDHATLRAESALCPADITQFTTSFSRNQFIIESDLEVYITSCQMAVADKEELEEIGYEVKGLPEASRCFFERGEEEKGGWFNNSLTTEEFLDMKMLDIPFSDRSDEFKGYVRNTPQFLMYADLGAIYPVVNIRQKDWSRDGTKSTLKVVEKLVSTAFPIRDERAQDGLDMDLKQAISLQEVKVEQYLNPFLGWLGKNQDNQFYRSVEDTRGLQKTVRNVISESGFNVFHGKIVKYDQMKTIKVVAYSCIELIVGMGGLIGGIRRLIQPIANIFSELSFELGVINLLFRAKVDTKGPDQSSKEFQQEIDKKLFF